MTAIFRKVESLHATIAVERLEEPPKMVLFYLKQMVEGHVDYRPCGFVNVDVLPRELKMAVMAELQKQPAPKMNEETVGERSICATSAARSGQLTAH